MKSGSQRQLLPRQNRCRRRIISAVRSSARTIGALLLMRPAHAGTDQSASDAYLFVLVATAIAAVVVLDHFSERLARAFDHPRWVRLGVLSGSACLLLLYRVQENRLAWHSETLIGLVFALLAYLAVLPILRRPRDSATSPRRIARAIVVRAWFAANIVLVGLWFVRAPPFAGVQPSVRPILFSEIALLALLHQPLITSHLGVLNRMRGEAKLFAWWVALAAFLICVSSPLAMYASSEDFSGSPLALADNFLVNFVVTVTSAALQAPSTSQSCSYQMPTFRRSSALPSIHAPGSGKIRLRQTGPIVH
jgi:hypothetical protein